MEDSLVHPFLVLILYSSSLFSIIPVSFSLKSQDSQYKHTHMRNMQKKKKKKKMKKWSPATVKPGMQILFRNFLLLTELSWLTCCTFVL